MSFRGFPNITPNEPWSRTAAAILQWVRNGKLNNGGQFTLDANVTSTTLTDTLIGPDSVIALMPMHVDASGALAGLYFSTPTTGSVTVNHANTASVNKTFRYTVTG